MSQDENKNLKKGNNDTPDTVGKQEEKDDEAEGYAYCSTHKQKCLNDCAFGGPSVSHIN